MLTAVTSLLASYLCNFFSFAGWYDILFLCLVLESDFLTGSASYFTYRSSSKSWITSALLRQAYAYSLGLQQA